MSVLANIYKDEIDFAALARQDADFAKMYSPSKKFHLTHAALKSNGQLDFSNPESVQQLTKSLLKRDFGLSITLPPDRLCPPVPNRSNYILWIQSLLDSTSDSYKDSYDAEREVLGIDIGTGASSIYPLLGCTQRPKWRFAATDIDKKSLEFARQNVQNNGLQSRIKLLRTQPDDPLLPLESFGTESMDFSMCNPPFYTSTADMLSSAALKQKPPFTACTGSTNEMVTPGGEVFFVSRMINESLILKDRVQWYTSMLGKFSSIEQLVKKLRANGIENYAITEFVHGSKTRRWAIAWSLRDLRPSVRVARSLGSLQKGLLPFPAEYLVTSSKTPIEVGERIHKTLATLPLRWIWKAKIFTGIGFSHMAVWSRAARRKMSRTHDGALEHDEDRDGEDMSLGFKIQVEAHPGGVAGSRLTIRWLKGHDSVLFESLCGMLKRKVE